MWHDNKVGNFGPLNANDSPGNFPVSKNKVGNFLYVVTTTKRRYHYICGCERGSLVQCEMMAKRVSIASFRDDCGHSDAAVTHNGAASRLCGGQRGCGLSTARLQFYQCATRMIFHVLCRSSTGKRVSCGMEYRKTQVLQVFIILQL